MVGKATSAFVPGGPACQGCLRLIETQKEAPENLANFRGYVTFPIKGLKKGCILSDRGQQVSKDTFLTRFKTATLPAGTRHCGGRCLVTLL